MLRRVAMPTHLVAADAPRSVDAAADRQVDPGERQFVSGNDSVLAGFRQWRAAK